MLYNYKFNGLEFQDEMGLNLYDMPFRDYDPAIGRWTGMDPVIDFNASPYNGYDNNPVFWADPSGADVTYGNNSVTASGADIKGMMASIGNVLHGDDPDFELIGNMGYQNDDIININTKDKTVIVTRTGDNYDRIFVNGKEIMATIKGLLGPELRENGYAVSEEGPYGVGMGLTDLVVEAVNLIEGASLFKMGTTKILKSSAGFKVGFGASKETLQSSAYFTKLLGFRKLPVSRLPTLYGPAKDWGTFLGRNAPIFGGIQVSGGIYGIYSSTNN